MKSRHWFKKVGWIHYPISLEGYSICTIFIIFLVLTFLAIDKNSHSVSDTLYGIFPFWVPAFLLTEWIAGKASKN